MNDRQVLKTLNAYYVKQTSQKTGKPYNCIIVELCEGREKYLMINNNEKFIIEKMNPNKQSPFNK